MPFSWDFENRLTFYAAPAVREAILLRLSSHVGSNVEDIYGNPVEIPQDPHVFDIIRARVNWICEVCVSQSPGYSQSTIFQIPYFEENYEVTLYVGDDVRFSAPSGVRPMILQELSDMLGYLVKDQPGHHSPSRPEEPPRDQMDSPEWLQFEEKLLETDADSVVDAISEFNYIPAVSSAPVDSEANSGSLTIATSPMDWSRSPDKIPRSAPMDVPNPGRARSSRKY